MKCSNCGADLDKDAKSCDKCGKDISDNGKIEKNFSAMFERIHKVGLVMIGIIMLILMVLCFFRSLNSREEADDNASPDLEKLPEVSLEDRQNFEKAMEWIQTNSNEENVINVFKQVREPAERDYTLKWDSRLFYYLEDIDPDDTRDGQLIYDNLSKYEFVRNDTGNMMEVMVYRDPNSNDIHKIVSINYQENGLHICEYYFELGKLNFAFYYYTQIYTPTYATLAQIGERFYFNNDVMVKYRNVMVPYEKQDYDIAMWDSFDITIQQDWNIKEIEVINSAYLVYQLVNEVPRLGYIEGYVYDTDNNPVENEQVCITSNTYGLIVGEVYTDKNGKYRCTVPADNLGNYDISIGDNEVHIYEVQVDENTGVCYVYDSYIPKDKEERYYIEILLCDAVSVGNTYDTYSKMKRLTGAVLKIRSGINNRKGNIVLECATDENGYADAELSSGCYTGEVIQEGYETTYFTFVVKKDCLFIQNIVSPILEDNEYRIVLSWDEEPADLDAHLFTPYWDADGNMCHIGFYDKQDEYGNILDVDDMDGYGPETITISDLQDGNYKYYVTDYRNSVLGIEDVKDLSNSNAIVNVYGKEGLEYQFVVPPNKSGTIWEVFEIRNKKIVPVQRIYEKADEESWWFSQGVSGELSVTEDDYDILLKEISGYEVMFNGNITTFDMKKNYESFFPHFYQCYKTLFPEILSDIEIFSDGQSDPLNYSNGMNSFGRLLEQNVDWILRNVLNQEPDHTICIRKERTFVYYESGYYYFSLSEDDNSDYIATRIINRTMLNNHKMLLEIEMGSYNTNYVWTVYAIVQLRRNSGVRYWTLEQVSHSPINNSSPESSDEVMDIYNSLIHDFMNGEFPLADSMFSASNYDESSWFFTLMDLNNDGIMELLITAGEYAPYSVFIPNRTYDSAFVGTIQTYDKNRGICIKVDNGLKEMGVFYDIISYCQFNGSEFVTIESYECDSNTMGEYEETVIHYDQQGNKTNVPLSDELEKYLYYENWDYIPLYDMTKKNVDNIVR